MKIAVIIGIIAATLLVLVSIFNSTRGTHSVVSTEPKVSRDQVGSFYSSAITYLGDLRDQAAIADGAMIEGSSLGEVRSTLQSVQAKENNAYRQYSERRLGPLSAQDLAQQVDLVHQSFQDSLAEVILGANGPYPEHIAHGGEAFKHSLELANALTVRINDER